MQEAISIKTLEKKYNKQIIFDKFNLAIKSGEITAVFGPNGCGKSTLFNILSGIIESDAGEIKINNFDKFKFSYVSQNYRESLLPWKNNFDNIALPLKIQKINKKIIKEKINKLCDTFNFGINLYGYPYELSGGQQQLLVFMRALITEPNLILLDEPFSALDYENNIRLRNKLQKYYLTHKPTVFIITHNIEEAVYLAKNIIILSKKPSQILDKIHNSLPYPRTIKTLEYKHFEELKNKALEIFKTAANL